MSLMRRARWPSATPVPSEAAPVAVSVAAEMTYKGYRIEPASYGVNTATWSPRAVVSVRTDGTWARLTPLYSTSTARFPTRDEADLNAVAVAKAWIDRAVAKDGDDGRPSS